MKIIYQRIFFWASTISMNLWLTIIFSGSLLLGGMASFNVIPSIPHLAVESTLPFLNHLLVIFASISIFGVTHSLHNYLKTNYLFQSRNWNSKRISIVASGVALGVTLFIIQFVSIQKHQTICFLNFVAFLLAGIIFTLSTNFCSNRYQKLTAIEKMFKYFEVIFGVLSIILFSRSFIVNKLDGLYAISSICQYVFFLILSFRFIFLGYVIYGNTFTKIQ